MRDEDIDLSDSPELTEEWFRKAVRWPPRKKQVTLRIDEDVLEFFRERGRGYQTRINGILRQHMRALKKRAS